MNRYGKLETITKPRPRAGNEGSRTAPARDSRHDPRPVPTVGRCAAAGHAVLQEDRLFAVECGVSAAHRVAGWGWWGSRSSMIRGLLPLLISRTSTMTKWSALNFLDS